MFLYSTGEPLQGVVRERVRRPRRHSIPTRLDSTATQREASLHHRVGGSTQLTVTAA